MKNFKQRINDSLLPAFHQHEAGISQGTANLRAKEDPNNTANATADDVEKANHAGRTIQNDLENLLMCLVSFGLPY